jgi:hypothetical protein
MPTDLPSVVRLTVEGAFDAERFVNVMHFRKVDGTAFSVTDIDALLDILEAATTDNRALLHIYDNLDAGLVIDTLTAKTLDSTTPIEEVRGVTLAGTEVGNNAPPMLAALVRWSTAIATRSARGRTYFTGLNTPMISTSNADQLDSTYRTQLQTAVAEFANAWFVDGDFEFIVLSQKGRLANEPAPYHQVQSGSVEASIALQRRRRQQTA